MYPILYQLGPFTLKTASIFWLIGAFMAVSLILILIKKKKLSLHFLSHQIWWLIGATLLGGRIGFFLENSNASFDIISFFSIWDGNFSLYLGLIFFLGTLLFLCKQYKKSFWKWLDTYALAFLIFFFWVSIGDYFSASHFGIPPSKSWLPAVYFDTQEIPFTIGIHPVQLYTAVLILVLFFIMRRFERYRRKAGMTAVLTFSGYFALEFAMEFLRGTPAILWYGYRLPQILDAFFILVGIVFLIIKTHQHKPTIEKVNP